MHPVQMHHVHILLFVGAVGAETAQHAVAAVVGVVLMVICCVLLASTVTASEVPMTVSPM